MALAGVAKGVGKRGLFAWCADAPIDHALVRIQARRETQQLDQMLGCIVVVVVRVVFDDESHNMFSFLVLNKTVAGVFIA